MNFEAKKTEILKPEEIQAIKAMADMRKRQLELKIASINIEKSSQLERDKVKSIIKKEVSGETEEKYSKDDAYELAPPLLNDAEQSQDYAPALAAFDLARSAKILQLSGFEYQEYLANAQDMVDKARQGETPISPAALLPDAYIIGINSRQLKSLELPETEKVAKMAASDPKILAQYAFVLPEAERERFLQEIPEDKRKKVSVILDNAVSKILHASVVEAKLPESVQRAAVMVRLEDQLTDILAERNPSDQKLARLTAETFNNLGGDAVGVLVRLAEEEAKDRKFNAPERLSEDMLPRLLKVILEEFEDPRGNDIALQLSADENLHPNLRVYLLKKLVDNGYLDKEVEEWWNQRKNKMLKKGKTEEKEDKEYRLAVLSKITADLGVIPTKPVIDFITDDKIWQQENQVLSLEERVKRILQSQKDFEGINDNKELVSKLTESKSTAMTYFLLNGGKDRFGRYNNYTFEKFWDMLEVINQLEVHEKPIKQFEEALIESGKKEQAAREFIDNLKKGQFPLPDKTQAKQECNLDVSENERLIAANRDLSLVLGKNQLGIILKSPIYREYLKNLNNQQANKLLNDLAEAKTFIDREAVIAEIEQQFPDLSDKAKNELQESWSQLNEKMLLGLSLETVFNNELAPIKGEDLLPLLDTRRLDLKRMKKETLAALKGTNVEIKTIQNQINKKKKAKTGLQRGLDKQTDQAKIADLQEKINKINSQIDDLEKKRDAFSNQYVGQRYEGLSEAEKKQEIDKVTREIIALTEKDPSAIFTYVIMQVLDESNLTENDIGLIREMESHLAGPFQILKDFSYFKEKKTERQERITLQYLDKTDRLMSMVRFADSFTCCFTTASGNYDSPNSFAYDQPNKVWISQINADPMSFVISLELSPQMTGQSKVHENIGFIFGSFGLDQKREPAIVLNGLYSPYKKGEDAEIILQQVEKMFKGSGVKTIAFASKYGGSLAGIPKGYSNSNVDMIRLRALDGGDGRPETTVYDDLDTGHDLNKPHLYGGHVWHKKVKL